MLEAVLLKRLPGFQLAVDLALPPGITVLLGANGAGKSTLLNIIAGLIRPDTGRICLNGRVLFASSSSKWRGAVNLPPRRRRLGYVFQRPNLFPHLNVRRNLAFGLPRSPGAPEELEKALDLLRLRHLSGRIPGQLSGGEAQRVALGRALLARPSALLLDEPFSAQDHASRTHLQQLLLELVARRPLPVLFVTHDQAEAAVLAQRVLLLRRGRLAATGPGATSLDLLGSTEGHGGLAC